MLDNEPALRLSAPDPPLGIALGPPEDIARPIAAAVVGDGGPLASDCPFKDVDKRDEIGAGAVPGVPDPLPGC